MMLVEQQRSIAVFIINERKRNFAHFQEHNSKVLKFLSLNSLRTKNECEAQKFFLCVICCYIDGSLCSLLLYKIVH